MPPDTSSHEDAGPLRERAGAPPRRAPRQDVAMNTSQPVWLTPSACERLRAELAELRGDPGAGADGSDTAVADPEHFADHARRRARIQQIQDLLGRAVVGETPPDDGVAEPGMVLTVRFDGDGDTDTFLLGTRSGNDPDGVEVCSPESPLGAALLGARQGDRRSYLGPVSRRCR